MQPKISIIIATYNSGKTLRTALDSVLNQKFQDWECIVVDGASKDDTVTIVEEYEQQDSRFRHISEKDHGIYDAFNKGWKMAKGEWIYYLGSDDMLLSTSFSGLFEVVQTEDIAYGNVIFDSGVRQKRVVSPEPNTLTNFMISHQAMIMKRNLITLLGGFNGETYKLCADFDLVIRAIKHNARVYRHNVDIAIFNCQGASSSSLLNYLEPYNILLKNEIHGHAYMRLWLIYYVTKGFIRNLINKIR